MIEVILKRAVPRYQGKDIFPNFVIGKGETIDECKKISKEFADNNDNWCQLSWEYREVK